MKTYLNIGCGSRYHPDWTNVDSRQTGPEVIRADGRRPLPFDDASFQVVYHSHLLEHLDRDDAPGFLAECYRLLKPGGVLRVAVPDLEAIARLYLKAVERAELGDEPWRHHHDWMMLELYDQTTREHSGGRMLAYFYQDPIPNPQFVIERTGVEARRMIELARQSPRPAPKRRLGLRYRCRIWTQSLRERLVQALLPPDDRHALVVGRFRRSGEVHQWMYDRHSLGSLLREVGFVSPRICGPTESDIPDWMRYALDTEPDGEVYKPDSLYMEARKPNTALMGKMAA